MPRPPCRLELDGVMALCPVVRMLRVPSRARRRGSGPAPARRKRVAAAAAFRHQLYRGAVCGAGCGRFGRGFRDAGASLAGWRVVALGRGVPRRRCGPGVCSCGCFAWRRVPAPGRGVRGGLATSTTTTSSRRGDGVGIAHALSHFFCRTGVRSGRRFCCAATPGGSGHPLPAGRGPCCCGRPRAGRCGS